MVRRKRKRTYIDGDGKEHLLRGAIEIDLSHGSLEEMLEDAVKAEDDDQVIAAKAEAISSFLKRTTKSKSTLDKWYQLGRLLQFIDNLKLVGEKAKREALERLFKDLGVDPSRDPSERNVLRYPYHMYTLAKLPKDMVFKAGMNWSKWFDILEYQRIVQNSVALKKLIDDCCTGNWDSTRLRQEVQKLNRLLKSQESENEDN